MPAEALPMVPAEVEQRGAAGARAGAGPPSPHSKESGGGQVVEGVVGVGQQVAPQRAAYDRLLASEHMLAEAEKLAHMGSFVWEVAADCVTWSDGLCQMFGLEAAQAPRTAAGYLALVHPDDRERVREAIERALQEGKDLVVEERVVRPDGGVRLLESRAVVLRDPDGAPARMVGICKDVTAHREREREVREQRDNFHTLLKAQSDAGVGVAVGDPKARRMVFCNEAMCRLSGYSEQELMALPDFLSLIAPEARQEVVARLQRSMRGEVSKTPQELRLLRKDGSTLDAEYVSAAFHEGGDLRLMGIVRDVSERKRAEQERQALGDREREVQALRERDAFKTRFVNTAAHELNTPLTPIRLQVHLLRARLEGSPDPDAQRSLDILDRNVERLCKLVKDVLDAARLQGGKLSLHTMPVDLSALAREAVESFAEPCKVAGVRLEAELGGAVGAVADGQRVMQVLYNLLGNALKFTPAGGSIVVRTHRRGNEAMVSVSDTGAGIRPEDLPRLFQPFSQINPGPDAPSGTGLGLYIARGIVEAHRGSIQAASPGPGRGSTFIFALPATDLPFPGEAGKAPRATKGRSDARPALAKRLRELI